MHTIKHTWSTEEDNLLYDVFDTMHQSKIQEKYFPNLNFNQVRHRIRQLNLKSKTPIPSTKKYYHIEDFFSIPNLNNSYWAGFIAADGHIEWIKEKYGRLVIHLSKKDEDHLVKFKQDIQYTGNIKVSQSRHPNYPGVLLDTSRLTINSFRQGILDLEANFNIPAGNKTLKLDPPSNLSIEHKYAFLKGFIDGDGHIGVHIDNSIRRNRVGYSINISVCGTLAMVEWVKETLNTLALSDHYKSNNQITKREKIWTYNWVGLDALVVLNKLHKIDTPELDRKWSKVDQYKQMVIQAYGLD